MSTPHDTAPAGDQGWQRLSARMLLIHPLRSAKEVLPGLIPALVLGASRSEDGGWGWWWLLGSTLVVLALASVRWATTTFRVSEGRVQQRHGLLRRETLTVPVDRVRTVDVAASPLHRVLRLRTTRIGTGVSGGRPLVLDGLTVADADRLRHALLAPGTRPMGTGPATLDPAELDPVLVGPAGEGPDTGAARAVPTRLLPPDPEVLVRFSPSWVRYAPFTYTGLAVAGAILGFCSQYVDDVLTDERIDQAIGEAAQQGLALLLVGLGLGALGFVLLCAVVGYVLTSWGHTVTRTAPTRLHVSRGLLTVRATTIDLDRLRGVRRSEPLPLRLVRGASLSAVTTGLGGPDADDGAGEGSGAGLLPASPRHLTAQLAAELLGAAALDVPLASHGPAARRRRRSRAVQGGLALLAPAVAVVAWQGWSWWWCLPAAVLLLAAPALAEDRYRQLGHTVLELRDGRRLLVIRQGSLLRRTVALDGQGVVGWTIRQSWWQRRAGIATLVAATAAGAQGYRVVDLPVAQAWPLARRAWGSDPAGEPHVQLPLGVRDDLCGVERPEEHEARHRQGEVGPGHGQSGASARG